MKTLVVVIRLLEGKAEAFIEATLENEEKSRKEPGIERFELYRDDADPCRFLLLERYRDAAAQAAHRESPHYLAWKEQVEPMMAEPRTRAIYSELGPAPSR